MLTVKNLFKIPPFSLIRAFGKQNTRGNLSKISVSHTIPSRVPSGQQLSWGLAVLPCPIAHDQSNSLGLLQKTHFLALHLIPTSLVRSRTFLRLLSWSSLNDPQTNVSSIMVLHPSMPSNAISMVFWNTSFGR